MNKTFFYHALSALFIGGMAFSAVSCADDDLGENANNGNNGAVVRFNVSDVQEDALARGGALTRGSITPGLTNKELEGQKLLAEGDGNLDACLIETVMEGVNPVKVEPSTRANIVTSSTLGNFSSTGIRGTVANSIGTNWFDNKSTTPQGNINPSILWSWGQRYARFYAVYPETTDNNNNIVVKSQPTATSAPTIEFTVNKDVTKQVDLMTACSGLVTYTTHNQAPETNLWFRHALTAIRFAVGQDLSYNKTIKEISIDNVLLKSKYRLPNDRINPVGAGWDNNGYSQRGKVTLSGLSYKTTEKPNSIIRNQTRFSNPDVTDLKQLTDGYTFYMIPQTLDGNSVKAEIVFSDGTKIHVPLKGTWREGTTHVYKLSEKNSNWEYELIGVDPNIASFTDTQTSGGFTILSRRRVGTEIVAVPWEVVGYSEDGKNYSNNKPAWLKSLSAERGNGSKDHPEQLTATLIPAKTVDLLAARNNELKKNPLGSEATPYNLSNKTGAAAVENTANCYVISAPGYYMIPLVYGNAIKGGATNSSAYKMTVPGNGNTLTKLRDQDGNPITDPWIEKTNNGANRSIDKAWVLWSDESNLVKIKDNGVYRAPDGNLYIKFQVPEDGIKSGNAVIAVRKSIQKFRDEERLQGRKKVTVRVYYTEYQTLWSWHLWFAPKDALKEIPVTNKQGTIYGFANEALGWKPTLWQGTPYQSPRSVNVKIRQTIGKKKETIITITQLPGTTSRTGYTTQYQWGRKDAFPGKVGQPAEGTIKWNAGSDMYMQTILQNPQNYYTAGYNADGSLNAGTNFAKYYTLYNLWSMNNTSAYAENQANSQTVVKTIYDPCPVGFSVPANDAFTGFTTTGVLSNNINQINADATIEAETYKNNFGHNFWTNSSKTETIFFPAAGYREARNGSTLTKYGVAGEYWTATPNDNNNGNVLGFEHNVVHPLYRNIRAFGFSVRPVAEK
ncbi:fimbrillin family protein [Prevotella melaninogenica]|jgi:conserved domain protein|uniref:Fimbrillin family protein n=1 Tax=Prevotella melaninogenica TaxID=28132 RepID=A0ABS6Y6B5_9BACT|nr:fimbrillin family protein [Prevotella melaninogenica]MBW4755041.1 fimbrillin family protein [Prevotella melaninogenica]